MQITNTELTVSLMRRYPNARRQIFDAEFDAWEPGALSSIYSQFIWQMRLLGLTIWLRNKLDCDKWAWLLKAYVILRNALSSNTNMRAIGLICYMIDGDPKRPHCIISAAIREGDSYRITELEPQPRGGLLTLTTAELATVWFVAY
ncbi:hypothetical protein QEH52_01840 [Coraliomargarita sp. SDUM461003]|uniref:Uncharacterized protein n=1 Tax=Thalassobacterium maritimum TaxID=3041265 RepID=A0ABU1APY7_9BACT|nr:hypothetical protein [Coraliomargarita sp. SDUM461003]MDQ8206234.1 hypothetical protein [Coraliomargarita sp. SDUM461003]